MSDIVIDGGSDDGGGWLVVLIKCKLPIKISVEPHILFENLKIEPFLKIGMPIMVLGGSSTNKIISAFLLI